MPFMIAYIGGTGILVAGLAGLPPWLIPIGALFLVDRSWHAQLAYRGRFSGALADNVLPYATLMCVLQAGLTASAIFTLGRMLGALSGG
jgi:hypothetical protein